MMFVFVCFFLVGGGVGFFIGKAVAEKNNYPKLTKVGDVYINTSELVEAGIKAMSAETKKKNAKK